jgi:hypothetical protein
MWRYPVSWTNVLNVPVYFEFMRPISPFSVLPDFCIGVTLRGLLRRRSRQKIEHLLRSIGNPAGVVFADASGAAMPYNRPGGGYNPLSSFHSWTNQVLERRHA